ncbi:hypothetical protein Pfo_028943 [Paulownia fortunei]|nr:hypothetical protein Pfo_028943 [Paulownia fortunei]
MDLKALPLHHNTIPAPPPGAAHTHHRPSFHVAFYWGKESQFLFSGWPDNNSGMYALALIFVFALAVLVEFLTNLNLAGIHAIRAGFNYMVILAVMSYNGGVFIAAVLGHAVGYVAFGSGLAKKETRR